MSTRSGKRIHNSISENDKSVSDKQVEINTRSKRVKEHSGEVATGKKKNFVRRPSNDEIDSSIDKTENASKSVRKSRRHTLKELNIPAEDSEALNHRKSMRQSRRTRKDDTVEPTNLFILETNVEVETKEKKKNKKKKGVMENMENKPVKTIIITKKKTNKKKRKSNSFTVEELVPEHHKSFNKSNVSIDSFHSAAGSPDSFKDKNLKIEDNNDKSRYRKESSTLKDTKKKNKKTDTSNQFETLIDKAVQLCALNESLESGVNKNEETRDENVNGCEKKISSTTKTKTKQKKSKKSNILSNIDNIHKIDDIIHNLKLHSPPEADIHNTDLKNKSNEKINSPLLLTSSSDFEFMNIPHVQRTVNDLKSILPLNNSHRKRSNSTSKNTTVDKIDISVTELKGCNEDMSDNLINKNKVLLEKNTTSSSENPKKSKSKDATYEKINLSDTNLDQTFDKANNSLYKNCNAVKKLSCSKRKSSSGDSIIKNTTYDKIDDNFVDTDTTFNKESSKDNDEANFTSKPRKSSIILVQQNKVSTVLNGTYDKFIKDDRSSFCNQYDKPKLNTTFEKSKDNIDGDNTINFNSKSSIISSDTDNMTSDMSEDCSRISIVSDDSRDNIVNTTPLLIESSMEESLINSVSVLLNKTTTPLKKEAVTKIITPDDEGSSSDNNETALKGSFSETKTTPLKRDGTYTDLRKTPSKHPSTLIVKHLQGSGNPTKPLQREGTFTKESPDLTSPIIKHIEKTPTRRKSMPSPGRTPFPSSGNGGEGRIALNVTHSIEKPRRRSSAAAAPPRPTRVMFRSPVDDPVAVAQVKGKVIKSNLKGSSKSFTFDASAPEQCGSRKRSRTHTHAHVHTHTHTQPGTAPGAKRARTASAAARLQAPCKVEAEVSSPATKSDAKPRTRLPDFAALHRKQFSKMESLDECQRRHARRARALLTPTAPLTRTAPLTPTTLAPTTLTPTTLTPTSLPTPTAPLTPIEPRGTLQGTNLQETSETAKRHVTQKSKEVDKKNQSYTRFGFKLNMDVNPFSVPAKTVDTHPKDAIKKVLKRQATLPSLAGTTLRKEAAKQAVMREKSFTDKRDLNRNQNRTVIKGVRTNRRFELQMKMRNID